MRKSHAEALSDVLKNVVEGLSHSKQSGPEKILKTWPTIAGKDLAHHTRPSYLHKGSLLILVSDSAWFYQANLRKQELLISLQKKLPKEKIKSIQFRIGDIKR